MRTYVVYLTEYSGELLPRWYIGSTYKDNIIKNNYNGSPRSKKWANIYNEEQENNRHLFRTEILYECFTREAALDIEKKYQILANAIGRDDYINLRYAGVSFGKANLTTPESIARGLETKRKNGTLGCSKETAAKIVQIKRKNGTLNHSEETIAKYKISMTLEDGTWNNNNEKRLKTVLTPNSDGITIAQIGGMNMRNTRMNKINEDGLNDYQVLGLNQSKIMSTILESGETEAKRRGKLMGMTRKELGYSKGANNIMAKKINIYNEKNELMYSSHGNFFKLCDEKNLPGNALSKSHKNNGRKIYTKKDPINKEYMNYKGWYAIEIKEK